MSTATLTRRDVLRLTAGTAATCALTRAVAAPTRPANIVFVFADQLRSHVLSCYGNRHVDTPHLDRVADEGVRFGNTISTWPVCSPFRAMLMTGLYPMHNGTVANDTAVRDGLPTIATVCKDNGYRTGYIGKWHLEWSRTPFVPPERRQGFTDFWASRNCSHQYLDSFYCGDTPERIPLPEYEPEAQSRLAAEFIRANADAPFCLFMSWGPPHDPYKAPDDYTAAFPAADLPLRPNVSEAEMVTELLRTDPTPLKERARQHRANWRQLLTSDGRFRETCLQGYYAATKALDDCMGIVLEALDACGLTDDTIVVFTSDHGDMMGSHRMISKQMPFEESISIPFLLRYPRRVPAGVVSDALMAPIDIMPTLLGLAGLPCPAAIDGTDLSAAAMDQRHDQQDALLIMKLMPGGNPWLANGVTTWRGLRTKRYTYARLLDRGPWVLFDNQKDPYQLRNLVDDPAYADLRSGFETRMAELMADAGDPGNDAAIQTFRNDRRGRTDPTNQLSTRRHFELHHGDQLPRHQAPNIADTPFTITAAFETTGDRGVIVAQGGIGSGYSLYLDNGHLVFATRYKGPLVEIRTDEPLTPGRHTVRAALTGDATVTLQLDGRTVASAAAPGMIPVLPGDGLQVGRDAEHPVSTYSPPNPLQGHVHSLTIDLHK